MRPAPAAVLAACLLARPAAFGAGTITDGNASFFYAPEAAVPLGNADFRADAASFDALFQHMFFFRLNNGATPSTVKHFGAPDAIGGQVYAGNLATIRWTGLGEPGLLFDALLEIEITDGAVAGRAFLGLSLTLTSAGATDLDLSVFNFADMDCGGSGAPLDTVTKVGVGPIRYSDTGPDVVDIFGVPAAYFQCEAPLTLRSRLTTSSVTNLANTITPGTPADHASAYQWDTFIPAGSQAVFISSMAINPAAIPGCPWDLNGDGIVNAADLADLLGAWGTPWGASALAQLLGSWGSC